MALFIRSLRDEMRGLVGWALLVAFTSFLYMVFYKIMITTGSLKDLAAMIDNLPSVMKAFIGGSTNLNTLNGFAQALVFNGVPNLYFTIFAAVGVLALSTRDMDSRTMEFVLSLPIRRWQVMAIRGVVLAGELVILQSILVLAAWAGGLLVGKQPDLALYATAGLGGLLLSICITSLMAFISTFIDDYQKGLFILLGFGFVLLFSGLVLKEPGTQNGILNFINPYTHFDTQTIFRDGAIPRTDLLYLIGLSAAAWAGALISFQRKQI